MNYHFHSILLTSWVGGLVGSCTYFLFAFAKDTEDFLLVWLRTSSAHSVLRSAHLGMRRASISFLSFLIAQGLVQTWWDNNGDVYFCDPILLSSGILMDCNQSEVVSQCACKCLYS